MPVKMISTYGVYLVASLKAEQQYAMRVFFFIDAVLPPSVHK